MEEIPGDAFGSFARWVDIIYGTSECFDPSFNGIVERSSNVEWGAIGTDTGSNLIARSLMRYMNIVIIFIDFRQDDNGITVSAHKLVHFW